MPSLQERHRLHCTLLILQSYDNQLRMVIDTLRGTAVSQTAGYDHGTALLLIGTVGIGGQDSLIRRIQSSKPGHHDLAAMRMSAEGKTYLLLCIGRKIFRTMGQKDGKRGFHTLHEIMQILQEALRLIGIKFFILQPDKRNRLCIA